MKDGGVRNGLSLHHIPSCRSSFVPASRLVESERADRFLPESLCVALLRHVHYSQTHHPSHNLLAPGS